MAERPHLSAAFLCEKVLQEKDGVLSAIRIVDTFYVALPKDLPADAKPSIQATLLLGFRKAAGNGAEKHQVQIRVYTPNGELPNSPTLEFYLPKDEVAGANLIVNLTLSAREFGACRVEVFVDDALAAIVPFRLLERPEEKAPVIH